MGLFDKMISCSTLYKSGIPTFKFTRIREEGKMRTNFEYTISHPENSDKTLTVYGQVDDNKPMIHFVEPLNDDEFKRLEDRIYNLVLEEWVSEYSRYCDLEYEAQKDRLAGI